MNTRKMKRKNKAKLNEKFQQTEAAALITSSSAMGWNESLSRSPRPCKLEKALGSKKVTSAFSAPWGYCQSLRTNFF